MKKAAFARYESFLPLCRFAKAPIIPAVTKETDISNKKISNRLYRERPLQPRFASTASFVRQCDWKLYSIPVISECASQTPNSELSESKSIASAYKANPTLYIV